MTTPEPVDETAAPPAETRGGNHLADITVPPPDVSGMRHVQNEDGSFCCDEDED